jgi:hypothetical protein
VHFLEPVPTVGLSYGQRETLLRIVWERMATALERYGVESDRRVIDRDTVEA